MTSPLNSSTSRKTVVYWFLCFAIFGQIMELIFADGEPWIPVHFVIPDGCLNGYNLQGPTGISVLLLQSTGTAFAKGLSFNGRVLTGHVTRIGEYRLVRSDGSPSSDECSLTFHAVQDECVSNPCQNGGTCHDDFETYTCTCARGWTGTNCQTDINECASSPCQNDGICRNGQNMYMCSCVAGWIGTNCETDINECTSNPCRNNASCINGQNSYTCLCESGWTGRRCETDINECVSNPCQNNASCIDIQNSYTCLCKSGWTGRICETDTLRLSTLDSKRVDVLVLKIGIPVGVTSLCVFVGFAVYIVRNRSVHERAGANDHPNPMENAEYMEMVENELYAEIEPIEHEYALMDDVIIRPQTSNESNSYLTAVSEHCTPREYCASDCQTKKEPGSPRELASSHMDTDTYESLQQRQSSVEDEYDMLGNIDIVDNGSLVMTSDERPESNCYLTPSNQAEGSYNEEDDYLKPEPSTTCRLFKSGRK